MGRANVPTANASILCLQTLLGWCDDMLKDESKLRTSPKNYHDRVFEEEIIGHINITKHHYDSTSFKDALKYGFYEFQNICGWYREVIADVGMHADLAKYWLVRWPSPGCTADHTLIEAGAYMRTPKRKPDSPSFDPKLPKSVRVYVATWFRSPSGKRRVQAVREAYSQAQDR
ncbi:hypothetical protein EV363DRAFT_1514781 [Boletus edulis]|nr:hypothetical protein EV363DRAFT_1514781 [Boletus edulis]